MVSMKVEQIRRPIWAAKKARLKRLHAVERLFRAFDLRA
jgi:hypothetical protein